MHNGEGLRAAIRALHAAMPAIKWPSTIPMCRLLLVLMAACAFDTSLARDKGLPYVQLGHSGAIEKIVFTPDSRFALTVSGSDRSIRVWDVAGGHEIRVIKLRAPVSEKGVALSPDGAQIAVPSGDDAIRRWEIASGRELPSLRVSADSVLFTPDGGNIVAHERSSHRIGIYDIKTGKQVRRIEGDMAGIMALSPDGRLLVAASYNEESVQVLDFASGKEIRSLACAQGSRRVRHVEFSPDGRAFLCDSVSDAREKSSITVWDTGSWTPTALPKELYEARFSGKGNLVVAERLEKRPDPAYVGGMATTLVHTLYDVASQRQLTTLATDRLGKRTAMEKPVQTFALSRDGRLAMFASGGGARLLALFDLQSGNEMRRFAGHGRPVHALDAAADGKRLAVGGGGMINGIALPNGRVWDLASGRLVSGFDPRGSIMDAIRFSPDGKSVVVTGEGSVEKYDPASGKPLKLSADANGSSGTFSADGSRLLTLARTDAYSPDYELRIANGQSGNTLRTIRSDRNTQFAFSAAAISPDGSTALVGAQADHYSFWSPPLALWDLEKGKVLRYFDRAATKTYTSAVKAVAISADGRTGLSTKDDQVKLWDLSTGKLFRNLAITEAAAGVNPGFEVRAAVFSRDGRRVMAGFDGGIAVLWDAASGRALQVFKGHFDAVNAVAMSPDGRFAYTGSRDGTVRIWDTASGKERLQLVGFNDGEWIAITPEGYFNASPKGAEHLSVLTGPMEVASVDAYYEAFFRPDIVTAALQGVVIDTGTSIAQIKAPPKVEIVDTPVRSNDASITLTLRITDQGGGIGDVRVYRNGSAVGLESTDGQRNLAVVGGTTGSANAMQTRKLRIRLDPGVNRLRAIAFEASNQARSEYAEMNVETAVQNAPARPSLHAIVIGIDVYRNPKLALQYAVADAEAFAQTITRTGAGLFDKVSVTKLTTREDTSREAIMAAVNRMTEISPSDLFVFFVASHGTVQDGNYYLVTSNVGSISTERIKNDALSQTDLTRLLGNIPTSKKLVILDTCNSGAMGTALQAALLTRGMNEDTAVKVLGRAVGSTILSSATSTQEALEGYQGHGLFTYVLTEGLAGKADTNQDGFVTTAELTNYIDENVPLLAQKVFGREQFPTVNNGGQVFPVSRSR